MNHNIFVKSRKLLLALFLVLLLTILCLSTEGSFAQSPAQSLSFGHLPFKPCWSLKTETLRNPKFASDNNIIFIPLSEGILKAIDPITGETIWQTNVGGEIVSNILIDKEKGNLYLASISENQSATDPRHEVNILSLSLATGVTKWKKQTGSNLLSRLYILKDLTNNLSSIYVITDRGAIDILDTDSGRKIFNKETNIDVNTFPSAVDNKLFFGNANKLITESLNKTESSDQKESKEFTEPVQIGSFKNKLATLLLSNDALFIGDDLGVVYALSIKGKQKWTSRTGAEITDISDVGEDNLLISSSDNFVYLLSKNAGKRVWKKRLSGKSSGKPVVKEDIAIFSPLGEKIAVFVDLKKGQTVNQILLEPSDTDITFVGSPLTVGDVIIFSSTSGFYAYSSKDCGKQKNKEKREEAKSPL